MMFADKTASLFYLLSFISLLYNIASGQELVRDVANYGLLSVADSSHVLGFQSKLVTIHFVTGYIEPVSI